MLGNYQDTEDLVQEIFYKTYKSLRNYDMKKSQFRTWLYRISSNHTINYLNSSYYRHKSSVDIDDFAQRSNIDLEEQLVKDDYINRIVAAMKRVLSKKHQSIFSLRYFSGLSVKEISKVLSISEKTIYKAINTSIAKIKKEVTTDE